MTNICTILFDMFFYFTRCRVQQFSVHCTDMFHSDGSNNEKYKTELNLKKTPCVIDRHDCRVLQSRVTDGREGSVFMSGYLRSLAL